MILLDGKQTSAKIKVEIALAVTGIKKQGKRAKFMRPVAVKSVTAPDMRAVKRCLS